MKVTAIVPIYNENMERLASVLDELGRFVDEIVVVDDGSVGSIQITGNRDKVVLLKHKINRGQGAALQTGTDWAVKNGADIIVHFDGDGQHTVEDVPELVKPIIEGKVEFVFGSRFLSKKSNLPWSKKYIILPVARLVNNIVSGLKLTDVHNGMRAFSARVADRVYLSQDRMAHASEYPHLVKKNKISYTEVPIKVVYNEYGQGLSGGVRILKELVMGKIVK